MTTTVRHVKARAIPGRGDIVPVLRGRDLNGDPISTRDYYMRRNLVILFAGDGAVGAEWLKLAAGEVEAAAAEAGQIVVVVPEFVETFGLPTLVDGDGELRALFGLRDADSPALFITDRYGTVFVATHGDAADMTLGPGDIPRWLEFVACRCS